MDERGQTMNEIKGTRRILVGECGCGASPLYRLLMTDRLWNEFFSGPWVRPESVLACGLCANEFHRFAAPLVEVTA